MTMNTSVNKEVDSEAVALYFSSLVNRFFKILPMREQEEKSLPVYIESMQLELFGFESFMLFDEDPSFITLLSILETFKNTPDLEVKSVKREVFRAISICKKLESRMKDV